MTMEGIGLFAGIKAKLDYVSKNQSIISQNIANADTPGYQPLELKKADFGRVLESSIQERRAGRKLNAEVTNHKHMTGAGTVINPKSGEQRITYEVAPSGNAVVLEEQMIKANRNMMDHSMMTRLMNKNVTMIQKAIGQGGR